MTSIAAKDIIILDELKNFIISLSEEEFTQLENNIIQYGCRDPLTIWEKDGDNILVDGHHRYEICQKRNVPFNTTMLSLESIDDVKLWMLKNQIGRRNLTPDQLSYYRGLRYISLKNKKGGFDNVLSKGQNEPSTSELLSLELKVSESTIKRDAKFAEGISIIAQSNPDLKNKILKGLVKFKRADVQVLTKANDVENIKIKNEADLYNKAQLIKNRILSEIESEVKEINQRKIEEANEVILDKEPLFLDKDDRLRKIKGMIISAINRAINNKDHKAIEVLKSLIDRLEDAIFD